MSQQVLGGKSTVRQLLASRLIAKTAKRKNRKLCNGFIDFQKTCHSIDQNVNGLYWSHMQQTLDWLDY